MTNRKETLKRFLKEHHSPVKVFLLSFLLVHIIIIAMIPGANLSDMVSYFFGSIVAMLILIAILCTSLSPFLLIILVVVYLFPAAFLWGAIKVKNRYWSSLFAALSGILLGGSHMGAIYILGQGG